MFNRSKRSTDPMNNYYVVIGGFIGVCVIAVILTLLSPKKSFAEMDVIDDSQMLIHNGQGHQFKHGRNNLFEHKTLADAKQMFMSALSDTNNVNPCKTAKGVQGYEDEEIDVPESFDWREAYPKCVQPVMNIE